jgi:phage tail P2-like protein
MPLLPHSIVRSPALAQISDLARAEIESLRGLARVLAIMDIARVPASVLPYLAWQFRADVYTPEAAESVRRQQVATALDVWRRRGTLHALRTALDSLQVSAEVDEWWQIDPPGVPHTFAVRAYAQDSPTYDGAEGGAFLDEALVSRVRQVVDRVKPVRSQYTLALGARFGCRLGVAAVAKRALSLCAANVRVAPGVREHWLGAARALVPCVRRPVSLCAANVRVAPGTLERWLGAARALVPCVRRPAMIAALHLRVA